MPQSRRDFIKIGTGCALAIALGGSSLLLHSCAAARVYNGVAQNGEVKIPVSEFAKDKMRLVRIPKLKYDILVIKNSDEQYTALLLECTHEQYQLDVNAKGINCPAHGSAFDFRGNVKNGPAAKPLKKFSTQIDNGVLILRG